MGSNPKTLNFESSLEKATVNTLGFVLKASNFENILETILELFWVP